MVVQVCTYFFNVRQLYLPPKLHFACKGLTKMKIARNKKIKDRNINKINHFVMLKQIEQTQQMKSRHKN